MYEPGLPDERTVPRSANLDAASALDFAVGRAFFKRLWVTAPASTALVDLQAEAMARRIVFRIFM